jgi:Phage integrase family
VVDPDYTATVGLDRDQARALVAAADADTGAQALRTAAVVRLLLHNALRVDEACAADIADLSEDGGHRVLRVVRKGARKAKIPLTPAMVAALEAYWRDSIALRLVSIPALGHRDRPGLHGGICRSQVRRACTGLHRRALRPSPGPEPGRARTRLAEQLQRCNSTDLSQLHGIQGWSHLHQAVLDPVRAWPAQPADYAEAIAVNELARAVRLAATATPSPASVYCPVLRVPGMWRGSSTGRPAAAQPGDLQAVPRPGAVALSRGTRAGREVARSAPSVGARWPQQPCLVQGGGRDENLRQQDISSIGPWLRASSRAASSPDAHVRTSGWGLRWRPGRRQTPGPRVPGKQSFTADGNSFVQGHTIPDGFCLTT